MLVANLQALAIIRKLRTFRFDIKGNDVRIDKLLVCGFIEASGIRTVVW
jgi:hypothetical protein